jgi:hypothetical protein
MLLRSKYSVESTQDGLVLDLDRMGTQYFVGARPVVATGRPASASHRPNGLCQIGINFLTPRDFAMRMSTSGL